MVRIGKPSLTINIIITSRSAFSGHGNSCDRENGQRDKQWQLNLGEWLLTYYIPRTPLTSIFWRPTPQNNAFSNQNKGHLGSRYMYILHPGEFSR